MRKPAVADSFYPGSPTELTSLLTALSGPRPATEPEPARAVVVPHAGYVYSGALATKTYNAVKIPKLIVILGPNHTGRGKRVALSTDSWQTAHGEIPVNSNFCTLLQKQTSLIQVDESAHKFEHSIEVQLPFLQFRRDNLSIVPIIISSIPYSRCQELALAIASAVKECGEEVLIVASSDMNHFESREISRPKDKLALEMIAKYRPADLYRTVIENNISMCGVIPVVIAMLSAQITGSTSTSLVGYTDSGNTSGDTSRVVGYAGIIIH